MGRLQVVSTRWWKLAEQFAAHRPWLSALLLAPVLFVTLTCLFHPAYETNDDPAISMIAAGKIFVLEPDEHLIFTHPLIGLLLKNLYTQAPNIPWYALYLLTTQVVAHVVVTGLLLLYCPLRRALLWLAVWLGTIGIHFITHLQFTTTAFLAGMAGMLLLWEAARRVCARTSSPTTTSETAITSAAAWPKTPRSILGLLLAGGALVLWCEMIRWYMFYLIVVLPLPTMAVWWTLQRPGWRVTAKAVGVFAVVILGGLGMKAWHIAYYQADPDWRDFYEYNALRAQFNDTVKVVYNDQTRSSFEQAGWSEIDVQMIHTWCYDDPTAYSQEKLHQIFYSRTWQAEHQSVKQIFRSIERLFKEPPMQLALFLFLVLTLIVPVDRRQFLFNCTATIMAFATIALLSFIQKTPPARVYMPIMVWSAVSIGWNLLNRSLANSAAVSPLAAGRAWAKLFVRNQRAELTLSGWTRAVCLVMATVVLTLGMATTVSEHYVYQYQRTVAQGKIHTALEAHVPSPSQLLVLWACAMPVEDFNPLCSFAELSNYKMLWFGWPQQMPTHQRMKAKYGINNLLREWPEHPEIHSICLQNHTKLYAQYVKTRYGQEIRAVPVGTLLGNQIYRFEKVTNSVASEKQRMFE